MKLNPDRNVVKEVRASLKKNNGFCPCQLDKTEDTKCPCVLFREHNTCICELFVP